MVAVKKEETNDIVQYLIPALENLGIFRVNCKIDVTTEKSGHKRGDVWISLKNQTESYFEANIVALIEAKHRKTIIGDMDWRDAMCQGKEKATKQGLNYYIVTNCGLDIRFYNASNDEEIILDGKPITKMVALEIMQRIQTQVSPTSSYVIYRATEAIRPFSESKFRTTLSALADTYRSAGLKKGDERIDPTVSFVVLKYICENEKGKRTLNEVIKLWDDLHKIAFDEQIGDLKAEFDTMVKQIWDDKSEYKDNEYKDFKNLISFPSKLKNEHFKKIYRDLDSFHFHGANFDLFGAIYEEFASQTKKKEFGEFYTRRHITGMVARLFLRNETNPRTLKICDCACGTGGFLTEAYKALEANYSLNGKLNSDAKKRLKEHVFWGYDNDDKSVARSKLNMFLVGDGHLHIYDNDSLVDWNKDVEWQEHLFDYIMTNPPMGKYDGEASMARFEFTNERRYELLFAETVIKATKLGGEIAIVLNDGALETPTRENFRIKLLQTCKIYAIISLTSFAFAPYTKEKTYIVFMQRKQENEGIDSQDFPIWHFIVDYDGFANSDKRYKTKWHNDLSELEEKFDGAVALTRRYQRDRDRFERERSNYERKVNEREESEGLTGFKCSYVEMDKIGENNFHNLLSESHLRPYVEQKISVEQFEEQLAQINEKIKSLSKEEQSLDKVNNLLSGASSFLKSNMIIENPLYDESISEVFRLIGGNSGLTKEFIYYNLPNMDEEGIPILSGATMKENLMGYVARGAEPNGEKLKIFMGPALLVIRKGKAGQMFLIDKPEFTTNDDAYVLQVKEKWKDRVNLRWFAYQYQELFYNLTTAKSANATFNKEYAKRQRIKIPDITFQDKIANKLLNADCLIENLNTVKKQLENMIEYHVS
jgi:type I restriction-modification system DNA methylase subunit